MLADHARAMLVVEKKGGGPGGVNLYQSYGQSSCMNATVTVALEQDQSSSTPSTAGDEQPGSLRIMNHDGTRSSCLSHGSIKVKQEATKTPEKGRAKGGRRGGKRRDLAGCVGSRFWVLGFWVLKPQASGSNQRWGLGLGSGQVLPAPALLPVGSLVARVAL